MIQDSDFLSSAPCIINPRSASHKWQRDIRLRHYLQSRLKGPPTRPTRSKEESIRRAVELSKTNDFLVIVGGDGTISDVIQGIIQAGTNDRVRLGIIALGSGNAFQWSLGIPKRAKNALRLLTEGRVKPIDVIRVNGRIGSFINIGGTAECGYCAHKNFAPGMLGHFLSIWPNLFHARHEVEVDLYDGLEDGGQPFAHKSMRLKMVDCIVTKTRYFGYGWRIAPYAVIDDGYLDITFYEMSAPLYVSLGVFIYLGLLQRSLRHFKAKRMIIQGRKLPVQYNGEDLPYQDRLELEVMPKAIKIVVPD
jgi:diacylglycerol kinase (ATP)